MEWYRVSRTKFLFNGYEYWRSNVINLAYFHHRKAVKSTHHRPQFMPTNCCWCALHTNVFRIENTFQVTHTWSTHTHSYRHTHSELLQRPQLHLDWNLEFQRLKKRKETTHHHECGQQTSHTRYTYIGVNTKCRYISTCTYIYPSCRWICT